MQRQADFQVADVLDVVIRFEHGRLVREIDDICNLQMIEFAGRLRCLVRCFIDDADRFRRSIELAELRQFFITQFQLFRFGDRRAFFCCSLDHGLCAVGICRRDI
ncbi:hypothetical protein D3C81_1676170 [compost metagenome]